MAKFAADIAQGEEGRDPRATSATTTRVGLRPSSAQKFKQLGGEIVAEQSYSEGDSDFHAQLTRSRRPTRRCIFVPGYYTEVGTIARQARELGITVPLLGRRRLGFAAALGDRRRGVERLLLLEPLLGRRPGSRRCRSSSTKYKSANTAPFPTPWRRSATTPPQILADAITRAGIARTAQSPRRARGDEGLPGRHREDHDRRGAQRGEAGRRPEGRRTASTVSSRRSSPESSASY